jgi:tetratricopeptide (TPR) repeat protein
MAVKREQVVQTAEKYVARGKIEPAIREYRKLLEENPNDINTLNRVGDLYARIQRIDEAVDFFNQIAEQYAGEGFFVKAIAIYKKIIKLDPTRLDVYENLAELYHRQGLVTEARTQYQVLADYYQKHENATSTIAIYLKMAELEPNNPTYHVKLAELYQQQQLIEKAMGEYRIIAELMIAHGHPQEAAQVYERALAIDSTNIAFITDAALKLKEAAGTAIAVRFLSVAVDRNPQAAQVARLIGGPGLSGTHAGLGGTHAGLGGAAAPAAAPAPPVYAPPAPPAAPAAPAVPKTPATPEPPPLAAAPASLPDADLDMEIEIDLGADLLLDEEAAPLPALGGEDEGQAERFGLAAGFDPAFEVEEDLSAPPSAPPQPAPSAPVAPAAGGEEEVEDVFVLDIEDEEEPASLVKPPPDMLREPRRPAWAQEATPPPAAAGAAAPAPPSSAPGARTVAAGTAAPAGPIPAGAAASAGAAPAGAGAAAGTAAAGAAPPAAPPAPTSPGHGGPQATVAPSELPALPQLRLTGEFLINPFAALLRPADVAEPPRPPSPAGGQELLQPLPAETAGPAPSGPSAAPAAPTAAAAAAPGAQALPSAAPGLPGTPATLGAVRVESPAIRIDSDLLERTAAELQPAPAERYEDLVSEAEVLAKYGLEEKAIERLREAVRIKPRQFAAYLLLIQLQLDKGRHARVVELANQVARLSEAGDREPWAKLRRKLLAAGYRIEGDRVAAGPQLPVPPAREALRLTRPRPTRPPAADVATGVAAAATAPPPAAPVTTSPAAAPAPAPPAPPATQGVAAAAAAATAPETAAAPPVAMPAAPSPPSVAEAAPGISPAGAAATPPPALAPPSVAAPAPRPVEPPAAPGVAQPPGAAAAASIATSIPTVAPSAPGAAPPAAPPAASPAPARRSRKTTDSGIQKVLQGLVDLPARPGRAAKSPAAPPSQAPAGPASSATAAPPAAPAAPAPSRASAAPAAAVPAPLAAAAAPAPSQAAAAPAAAVPAAATTPAPPGPPLEPVPPAAPPPDLAVTEAEADLIELPPLLTVGQQVPPDEVPPPVEIFNPLEIGAMVESEEIDWSDAGRPRPGLGAAARTAGTGAPQGTAPPAAARAGGNGDGRQAALPGAGAAPPLAPAPRTPRQPRSPAAAPPAAAAAAEGLDDTGGMSWLDEAESGKHKIAARGSSLFDEEEDFFDLAGELEHELSKEPVFQGEDLLVQPEQSLEEIVEGFKRGVAEHLSPTDYDTHFNLGIAYREMGLLDEAIGEFQLSAKDAHYLVSCCSMLGLCFLDKGLPELALKWYRRGLEAESITEEDTLGLLYDMGCAYLVMGDKEGAYKTFVDAYGINTNYRDLVARIEELGRPH